MKFRCHKCGCAENTALCRYNFRGDDPALCSECDPKGNKKWHGCFPKVKFKEADLVGVKKLGDKSDD